VRELERSFREIRYLRTGFRLVHYSFQHDHAHLILEAADARELASGMKALGARLARAVNRIFRRKGAVLADRFHVHVLRTPTEVRRAIAYVLLVLPPLPPFLAASSRAGSLIGSCRTPERRRRAITRGVPTPPRDARLPTMDASPESRRDATCARRGREVTGATIQRSRPPRGSSGRTQSSVG
jgi:hypothetical protein